MFELLPILDLLSLVLFLLLLIDIDECASGEADCKQDSQCINVPGSYACQCKLGYHLTGDLCQGKDRNDHP